MQLATRGSQVRRAVLTLAVASVLSAFLFARGGSAAVTRPQIRPDIFFRVITAQRVVALTFDDGPFADYTPAVLQILRDGRAHATFFVVGARAAARPDLLRAIVGDGNEIGNHTWSHAHLTWMLDRDQNEEITRGADTLRRLGYEAPLFRPPYGLMSELGVRDAAAAGERTVLWTFSLDREARRHRGAAVAEILRRIRPGDIILAHDARPALYGALRDLLAGLEARGYRVVTVSQLLATGSV
jgi:peptidoglycan/xylan/chitin deacetylase (PgdA/CDA1 family)